MNLEHDHFFSPFFLVRMNRLKKSLRRARTSPRLPKTPVKRTNVTSHVDMATSPLVTVSSPDHSSPKSVKGRTIKDDYRSVVVDMCNISVLVLILGRATQEHKKEHWGIFSQLLAREGIVATPDLKWEGLFKFKDAEHMRRFICKLPQPLQNVTPYRR